MPASTAAVTGTSSTILAANSSRSSWTVQNSSASGQTVWVHTEGATATLAAPSIEIPAGKEWTDTTKGAITAIATGSVTVTVLER